VATARALGLSAEVVIQKFSASAALEAMRPLIRPGQRVLMPRAAEGRAELLDGLRALGAVVSTPVAYRTVAIDTAAACLRTRHVDVLTLCSPSAVASLMGALPPAELEGLAIVCLGETTAAAARAAGLRVEAVAARTSMRALVDAVSAVVRTRVAAV
jgi:uroporphyrinogen-III synthase